MLERYLQGPVEADLEEKMVFVAGPRQVGKTTLAKQILARASAGEYLSWDRRQDRRLLRAARWPARPALVVLDEIHKWRGWKRWLKGEYDRHGERLRFLVTGSARLDVYRRGGDSLQGRYHHYRLHPLSVAELHRPGRLPRLSPGDNLVTEQPAGAELVEQLLRFGGFPEPFLAANARSLRRWQHQRLERFFREDIRDLETVRDLAALQLLADMLAERVASPLSLNALREDLEVSHKTVARWLEIFERLYHVFRLTPYTARNFRGLKKAPKVYLWDWSLVADPGARFENLVAAHLLKFCHLLADHDGWDTSLHYLRDSSGREVDFLVCNRNRPWFLVEAKLNQTSIDGSLRYFAKRLPVAQAYQVVLGAERDFISDGIRCLPARTFLAALA